MRPRLSILAAATLALASLAANPSQPRYPSPVELETSPDGSRLFVVCEGTDEVAVYDLEMRRMLRRIRVGRAPKSIALARGGKRLYVANSWSDSVSEIDTSSLEVVRTLPAGYEPNAAVPDHENRFLYVANRIGNDVSIIDLATGQETKRLAAGRGASYLTISPDGSRMYCTHIYPEPADFRADPKSEIAIIDTARQVVIERPLLPGAAGVFHVALSGDGRLGVVAVLRPKNLVPMAHVAHGWVMGNSLAIFGPDSGEPAMLPLDELDRYFTPPFAVSITPDKSTIFVSTTGSDSVTVIDVPRVLRVLKSSDAHARQRMVNDLSASASYVAARIPAGRAPKGMVLSPDGGQLYVANRMSDDVSIIDVATRRVTGTIGLDAPKELTSERRGEQLFFSARFAFQGHFGCGNCHIESTFDALSWDLEPDGFGKDIVDNRLLEAIEGTEPFKWNGSNPNLETECGPRTERFIYRSQSFGGEELNDVVTYIKSIPARPNRFRRADGELTAAQERGRAIFERSRRRNGTPIAEGDRCITCHSGPHYTNQKMFNVGTGKSTDRSPVVDTPQLTNIALTAPYLHDGSARTLEEIWTVFNPNDKHGITNDLQKDELNDLIEYLKIL